MPQTALLTRDQLQLLLHVQLIHFDHQRQLKRFDQFENLGRSQEFQITRQLFQLV